jgi:hypothetical protein
MKPKSLIHVQIPRNDLINLPRNKRILFIGLAHIYNEINAIMKLLRWSAACNPDNIAGRHGQSATIYLFIQLLAGKLFESWEVFKKIFYKSKLSITYNKRLDSKASEALDYIKDYFDTQKLVKEIRNFYSFHYSPEKLDDALGKSDTDLDIYLERGLSPNNLFYFVEDLLFTSLRHDLKQMRNYDEIENLTMDLSTLASKFITVIDNLMFEISNEYQLYDNRKRIKIGFAYLRKFNSISIPWFSDTSELFAKRENKGKNN